MHCGDILLPLYTKVANITRMHATQFSECKQFTFELFNGKRSVLCWKESLNIGNTCTGTYLYCLTEDMEGEGGGGVGHHVCCSLSTLPQRQHEHF